MSRKPTYLSRIWSGLRTTLKGMRRSGGYMRRGWKRQESLGVEDEQYFEEAKKGAVTIRYPEQQVPVPDTGRYRLHMETDDCIGCDKCARICPVDCITIETFRADGDLGQTSDGTTKRLHLPVFDIDMGKCMYCGLCTTVCPTECLTMTRVYDFAEYDRDNFVYHFGAYSPDEEDTIRKETEAALAAKKTAQGDAPAKGPVKRRPIVRRKGEESDSVASEGPSALPQNESRDKSENAGMSEEAKPKKRPRPLVKRKPVEKKEAAEERQSESFGDHSAIPQDESQDTSERASEEEKPKKRPRPLMKKKPVEPEEAAEESQSASFGDPSALPQDKGEEDKE